MNSEFQTAIESVFSSDAWLGDTSNVNGLFLDGSDASVDYPFAVYAYDEDSEYRAVTPETTYELNFTVFADTKNAATQIVDKIRDAYHGHALTLAGYDNFIPPQLLKPGKVERDADRRWIGTITFTLKIA